jgi:hypothetical protein
MCRRKLLLFKPFKILPCFLFSLIFVCNAARLQKGAV